jgi:4-hydroxy-tetrahydrodipicolinate reductase
VSRVSTTGASSQSVSNNATTIAIAIAGVSGRMGQMLVDAVAQSSDCKLTGAIDVASSPTIGQDAAAFAGRASGVLIQSDIATGIKTSQVLIDFTRPEGTMAHLAVCRALGVKLVIGTTGFTEVQKLEIAAASKDIAIVMAPNMSVGVNVTLKLLELAAKSLNSGYDIEIIETHHRHKIDAPSGTALKMGEVVANALGRDLKGHAVFAREGITGARDPSAIGFSAIRGGDIVGDHTVMFAGIGERIEITHKSSTRQGYAEGALRAGRFLADKPAGLYDMFDVLGLQ